MGRFGRWHPGCFSIIRLADPPPAPDQLQHSGGCRGTSRPAVTLDARSYLMRSYPWRMLFNPRKAQPRPRQRNGRVRPGLEVLEDRCVLAPVAMGVAPVSVGPQSGATTGTVPLSTAANVGQVSVSSQPGVTPSPIQQPVFVPGSLAPLSPPVPTGANTSGAALPTGRTFGAGLGSGTATPSATVPAPLPLPVVPTLTLFGAGLGSGTLPPSVTVAAPAPLPVVAPATLFAGGGGDQPGQSPRQVRPEEETAARAVPESPSQSPSTFDFLFSIPATDVMPE
jgi:hypothetical protein